MQCVQAMAAANQSLSVTAWNSTVHSERNHRMSAFSDTASGIPEELVSGVEKTFSVLA